MNMFARARICMLCIINKCEKNYHPLDFIYINKYIKGFLRLCRLQIDRTVEQNGLLLMTINRSSLSI